MLVNCVFVSNIQPVAEPEDQQVKAPRHFGEFRGWLERLPGYRRIRPAAPSGIRYAGNLVDVFASFVSLDNQVDRAEAEVALDLLRHAFPEADHRWLARRLHRALEKPRSPATLALSLSKELKDDEIISLGLQLYLLVIASNSVFRGQNAFSQVMQGLGAEGVGELILSEMNGEPSDTPLPFDKISFTSDSKADVMLPQGLIGYAFCCYRSQDIVLIRNKGEHPIWISGSSIEPGQILRLRQHQSIGLPDWNISSDDITFFLNASRTGHRQSLYLNENGSTLSAERTRSRASTVRLDFGLNVHVEALAETEISLGSGKSIVPGDTHKLPVSEKLILSGGVEASLESCATGHGNG